MTLNEWFKEKPYGYKKEFAVSIGITPTWLCLILSGRRKCSATLAKTIEKAVSYTHLTLPTILRV